MLKDFNLLATTPRGKELEACSELRHLLAQIGTPVTHVEKSGVAGLIAAKTTSNSIEVIKKLREILHDRPYEFRYTLRIIPVENVVRTDLGEIEEAAAMASLRILENETFRVTVEKRFNTISSHHLIEVVAANIKREVDLNHPTKILLIEVIGGLTGISVIAPSDILYIIKEKML